MKIENIIKTNKPLKLPKQVIINIIYSGNHITLQLNKALKEFDVTLQQFNVLRILRGQNGNCMNLSDIQERMINTNSNTTRLIDKLVAKKYASREIDDQNRRKVNICITNKGFDLLKKLDVVIDENEEEKILENLTIEECKTLNMLLEKIRQK